jgi:hypothetical protein
MAQAGSESRYGDYEKGYDYDAAAMTRRDLDGE